MDYGVSLSPHSSGEKKRRWKLNLVAETKAKGLSETKLETITSSSESKMPNDRILYPSSISHSVT